MRASIAVCLVGCIGAVEDPVLRIEPAEIDVTVELGEPTRIAFALFADEEDVTHNGTYAIEGASLGSVDVQGLIASGSIAGRAQLAATFDGRTVRVPVRVALRSRRFEAGTPVEIAPWFADGVESVVDAALEPGDGAVLPPNLGRLHVHFAADDHEDVHEVTVASADLDLRVYAARSAGARSIELTPTEWYAIAESSRGGSVELAVRSTRIIARENVHASRATLHIAGVPIAREIMFTGRSGAELPQMWSYDVAASRTSTWMPALPAGSCVGCHVAMSRDGRRIAAGGNTGTVGSGVLLDVWNRDYLAPPNAAIGNWIAAAFDPNGSFVSTTQGILTHRDGTTARAIRDFPTDIPASQPAISSDGRMLAYVGGPIDPTTTNPITEEMRIHPFNAGAGSLGPGRVLVAATPGEILKLPEFSPDDQWVIYTRVRANVSAIYARPTDGRFIPAQLVADADFARFASPVVDDVVWIVMKRYTNVGARSQDKVGQLWAAAFYPGRGVASRPFYLPGQRADVAVLHAPLAIY